MPRAPSTRRTAPCSDRRSSAVVHRERGDVARPAAEFHADQVNALHFPVLTGAPPGWTQPGWTQLDRRSNFVCLSWLEA